MTAYFDQFIQDSVDDETYEGTAAVKCAHTVHEPAADAALTRVLNLIQSVRIDRVEFIHRRSDDRFGHKEYRGAVLYRDAQTPRPTPFVHVMNALLGYSGSGPMFSSKIMTQLGMSETVFNDMNDRLRGIRSTGKSYVVLALNVSDEWTYEILEPHLSFIE